MILRQIKDIVASGPLLTLLESKIACFLFNSNTKSEEKNIKKMEEWHKRSRPWASRKGLCYTARINNWKEWSNNTWDISTCGCPEVIYTLIRVYEILKYLYTSIALSFLAELIYIFLLINTIAVMYVGMGVVIDKI